MRKLFYICALLAIGFLAPHAANARSGDMFSDGSTITYNPPAWVPGARAVHGDMFGPPVALSTSSDIFKHARAPEYGTQDMFSSRLKNGIPDNQLYNWPRNQPYPYP